MLSGDIVIGSGGVRGGPDLGKLAVQVKKIQQDDSGALLTGEVLGWEKLVSGARRGDKAGQLYHLCKGPKGKCQEGDSQFIHIDGVSLLLPGSCRPSWMQAPSPDRSPAAKEPSAVLGAKAKANDRH